MTDLVILVDEHDQEIGTMEKMKAHQEGILHRAFSILLFNSQGDLLLQKRSANKYHSAGLWTNTCCSHPKPNEQIQMAATRRLHEEMGIGSILKFAFKLKYKTTLDNDLIENEVDHVYIGLFDGEPAINSKEVADWKFVSLQTARNEISISPESFTYWFKLIINHPEFGRFTI